jgi:hypothetical protein
MDLIFWSFSGKKSRNQHLNFGLKTRNFSFQKPEVSVRKIWSFGSKISKFQVSVRKPEVSIGKPEVSGKMFELETSVKVVFRNNGNPVATKKYAKIRFLKVMFDHFGQMTPNIIFFRPSDSSVVFHGQTFIISQMESSFRSNDLYTVIHFHLKLKEFHRFPLNRNFVRYFVWIWYSEVSVAKIPESTPKIFTKRTTLA